jgi:hypothetical protein
VRRRCKGVRVSLPSDVNATSVEALEVMPSGSVVVQVSKASICLCVSRYPPLIFFPFPFSLSYPPIHRHHQTRLSPQMLRPRVHPIPLTVL